MPLTPGRAPPGLDFQLAVLLLFHPHAVAYHIITSLALHIYRGGKWRWVRRRRSALNSREGPPRTRLPAGDPD